MPTGETNTSTHASMHALTCARARSRARVCVRTRGVRARVRGLSSCPRGEYEAAHVLHEPAEAAGCALHAGVPRLSLIHISEPTRLALI
eukprot:6002818-Alexandrium_andersonii.AAC.1